MTNRLVYVLRCPQCGAPLADTVRLCPYCTHPTSFEALGLWGGLSSDGLGHLVVGNGADVVMGAQKDERRPCPFCGAQVEAAKKACPYCGSKIVIERMNLRALTVEKGGSMVIQGGAKLTIGRPSRPGKQVRQAISRDDPEALRDRFLAGDDLDAVEPADGASLLHLAVRAGALQCARFLLGLGANVHLADDSGATPLHAAAAKGLVEFVELFLQQGVRTARKDKKGQTAAALARSGGHEELARRFDEAATQTKTTGKEKGCPGS